MPGRALLSSIREAQVEDLENQRLSIMHTSISVCIDRFIENIVECLADSLFNSKMSVLSLTKQARV